jgi:transcriptional regulator of heat shock response
MLKLDPRKEELLNALVREYVRTAEPIGSLHLAEKAGLDVSPATVRNELAELEQAGFLGQPHTSAGRIPTELAYRYFIEHLANSKPTQAKMKQDSQHAVADESHEQLKAAARMLAAQASECVFVSVDGDVYITGLSNLFAKPELSVHRMALEMGTVLDRLEGMIQTLAASDSPRALIGSENPLYHEGGMVYSSHGPRMRIGFFGPMRMDYERTIGLLRAFNDEF